MTTPPNPAPTQPSAGNAGSAEEALVDVASYPRKVLFVAGAGRSGTSTMAGLMQIMGLHVPQPEVTADATNPKGFGEPQWVVDHHDRLLREALVQVSDARPEAWFEAGRVATREPERILTADWLEGHFAGHPELVVKDPRLAWFLGLWRVAAARCGAVPVFTTMLRPPSEVVGSKQTYYANRLGAAHLTASWLNMMLFTERGTRPTGGAEGAEAGGTGAAGAGGPAGGARVFVRYADLLDDWVKTTMHVAETLGLQHVLHCDSEQIRDGHRFVDPGLRRMSQTLDDLALPRRLHELTAETWEQLNRLADPGGDTPEAHETLDELRAAYVDLYAESASISRSSAVAAEQAVKRQRAGAVVAPVRPSGADRIPHGVRAMVPPGVRQGLRRLAGRERPGA